MNDRDVPWTISDVVYALLVFILVIIGGSLVVLAGGAFGIPRRAFPIIATLAGYVVLLLVIWYFAIKKRGADWAGLGFRSFELARGIGLVLASFFLVRIVSYFYIVFAQRVGLKEPEDIARQIPEVFGKGTRGFVAAFLIVVVLAPIVEELFFRGFLYPAFRQRWGVGAAVIISGALFAVAHFSLYLLVPIALIGFALAYLYEKSNSLGPPIMLHALNNFLSVVVVYYSGIFPTAG